MFNRSNMRYQLKNNLLDNIKKIPLSLEVKRTWIRASHYMLPCFQIFLLTFGNKIHFYMGALLTTMICVLFITLNGCILSSLENSLYHDNNAIVDVFLELLEVRKNKSNRYTITIIIFMLIIAYAIFMYNLRFR